MVTILDILQKPLEERLSLYGADEIKSIFIDGEEFGEYKAFSFLEEITYIEEPSRSIDGTMTNLDIIPSFITPRLKIDFSMLSIDSYRRLMNLVYLKREHLVTCFDIVKGATVTHSMYFAPNEMPKIWTIARRLNSNKHIELLGVQDYVIEMVGTNRTNERWFINYRLNAPSDVKWEHGITTIVYGNIHFGTNIGDNATVNIDGTQTLIRNIDFGGKYSFTGWNTKKDGTGIEYSDGDFVQGKLVPNTLYAQWS